MPKGAQLLGPKPLVRKIPITPETEAGKVRPYQYRTKCAKCGGKLSELNVWEAIRWTVEGERQVRLICQRCGKKAKRYYEGR